MAINSRVNSRAKGIRFERQLCQILSEATGKVITRNWKEQTAVGGYDLDGLEKFAIEVKACKEISVGKWWEQTKEQANKANKIPLLAYKPMQMPWVFVLELKLINPNIESEQLLEMKLDAFIQVVKFHNLI